MTRAIPQMKRFLYGLALGALCGAALAGALAPRRAAAQEKPAPVAPAPEQAGTESLPAIKITPEMVRYSHTRYALYFAGTLINVLALLVILRSGLSARIRDLAERRGRNGLVRAYIYYPLFSLAYGLLTLPLVFFSSYLLPHQYGLSNQAFGDWVLDGLKSYGVSFAVVSPVVALLYWIVARWPRRWWFGFWLASIPILIFAVLLTPILVEPLFNKFQPLRNEELRDKILALAARSGIEESRVFEVDASRRTKSVNAYVTGLGGSARIVLWDTLLQRLDEDEILAVMAHEMGHYVERHVPIGLTLSILGTFFFLLVTDHGTRLLIARNGERWQVRGLGDLASLPVLLLVLALLNFFSSPVESAISRTIESRADTYGLRLTGDGHAAASAFIKLSEMNLSLPDPPQFVEFWMFSHPPLQDRIDKALAWEAAESGTAQEAPPETGNTPSPSTSFRTE